MKPVSPDTRTLIGDYLEDLAAWRRSRYNDDLRDPRHLRSADGLLEFQAFLLSLPENDPRLLRIARLTCDSGAFLPGQQMSYDLGRFLFHDEASTFDGFLTRLVELAELDAGESGRFGGPQVPGDEPW